MSDVTHRLYRSRRDRMIGGVCAGLGHFLGLDPTIVRLLFVLSFFLWPGPGILLAYIVLLVIVPEEPLAETSPSEVVLDAEAPAE